MPESPTPEGRTLPQRYDVLKARAITITAPTGQDGVPTMYELHLVPIGPETMEAQRAEPREPVGEGLGWEQAVALREGTAAQYEALQDGLRAFVRGELVTAELVESGEV
jgi:hypothetical protein